MFEAELPEPLYLGFSPRLVVVGLWKVDRLHSFRSADDGDLGSHNSCPHFVLTETGSHLPGLLKTQVLVLRQVAPAFHARNGRFNVVSGGPDFHGENCWFVRLAVADSEHVIGEITGPVLISLREFTHVV